MSFLNELKRRNVLRVGAAYIVGSWLLIQVAETIFPLFGFGDAPARLVVIVLSIGLIPSLIFAWAFEFTPEGLKKEADVDHDASMARVTTRRLDLAILVVLLLALGYFAFDKFVLDPARDQSKVETARQEGRTEALVESYGDKSIAVLPFVDMSADKDQEYMSDGIAEELLNLLARIPELRVISRSSAFSYKGKDIKLAKVAEELNVAHILEGSVRKADNRVRITAQLIEAHTDTHLWSQTYDRTLDDIFAIQDEVAKEVVMALQIQLLGEAPIATSTNTEAYNLYLRGKHFGTLRTLEGLESAVKAYQESIALDADFAPAWAGLSKVLRKQGQYGFAAIEASRRAAMRALELDNELAEAWLALAEIQFRYDWDWSNAEVTTRTALKYGPKNAAVLRLATWVALTLGDPERALELALLGVELDPLDYSGLVSLGTTYWALERPIEEEQIYRHILELYPDWGLQSVKAGLASALTRQGKPEEGLRYLIFDSENKLQRVISALVLHSLGRHEEERPIRQNMIDEKAQGWAYGIALTYAWHGDAEKAFEWLDIAFKQKSSSLSQLIFSSWLAPLHDDPRWEKILDKMGLLKYWTESQARREEAES